MQMRSKLPVRVECTVARNEAGWWLKGTTGASVENLHGEGRYYVEVERPSPTRGRNLAHTVVHVMLRTKVLSDCFGCEGRKELCWLRGCKNTYSFRKSLILR